MEDLLKVKIVNIVKKHQVSKIIIGDIKQITKLTLLVVLP